MAVGRQLVEICRRFVIGGFDHQPEPMAGLEQQPVGADFEVEFLDLAGRQGLVFGMGVDRLPGFGFLRVQRAL